MPVNGACAQVKRLRSRSRFICDVNLALCLILCLVSPSLAGPLRSLQNAAFPAAAEPVIDGGAPTTTAVPLPIVQPPAVSAVTGDITPAVEDSNPTETRPGQELVPSEPQNQIAELTASQLTAPDGFIYDFSLNDVDYIPAERPLPFGNLTELPGVPVDAAAAYRSNSPSSNPLLTWRLDKLEHNKALWDRKANRKIKDAVNTLIIQADLYMREPVFLVANKTESGTPWEENDDPRIYFSLSDHYWPFQVSAVNRFGLPYRYNASVNLEVYELTPNKRHLELTIEHISTLALAYYFTGELKYAQYAKDKADAWFLNPETAMIAKYAGRLAAVRRGGTRFGRPEGIYDLARLPELLNGITLLGSSPVWSQDDTALMVNWVRDYVGFLEGDPVAKYARMMGNYIATNVDEQLLAAYLFLGTQGGNPADTDMALRIAHYSGIRQEDQIRNAQLHYETARQRSLDFSQQCIQSWVNIAIMSERLGVDVWYRGLGEGWSIKDAFDQNRGYFESLGLTWPFAQVGIPRVRVGGQLVLPLYVGYRLRTDPPRLNSGPVEYIPLYTDMWASFTTAGSQARGIIDRLPHLELDTIMADDGVPLIEECENLLCDSRTLAIWGATAFCITLVSMCLCWNCYIHWKADNATDVPAFLQNIREQQAKYKQMNLKVAPAKPDYMRERKILEEKRRMEERMAREEEKKDKELKAKIKQTEEKLQRRRTQSRNGSSFHPNDAGSDVGSSVNGHNGGMHMPPTFNQPQFGQSFGMHPFGHSSPDGWAGGHNVQAQVILEEGGEGLTTLGDQIVDNDFAFPGVHEQEGLSGDNHMSDGPSVVSGGMSYQMSPPTTGGGNTHAFSTGTLPSQSLTGILAGANELLGEIGSTQTNSHSMSTHTPAGSQRLSGLSQSVPKSP